MTSWLDEESYWDQLWEGYEAEYWADQERKWEESVIETDSKDSQKVLDTADAAG